MSEIITYFAETVLRVSVKSVAVTDPFKVDPGPHHSIEGLFPYPHLGRDADLRVTDTMLEVFAEDQRLISRPLTPPGK